MLGEESHLPGRRGGGDEGFTAGLLQLQGVMCSGCQQVAAPGFSSLLRCCSDVVQSVKKKKH